MCINLESEQHLGEYLLEGHLPVLPGGGVELGEGQQARLSVRHQTVRKVGLLDRL